MVLWNAAIKISQAKLAGATVPWRDPCGLKFHSRSWPATERSTQMKPIVAKTLTLLTMLAGAGLAQTPDFLPSATYATGGSSAYAAVGDFNGDGLPDIVTYESAT